MYRPFNQKMLKSRLKLFSLNDLIFNLFNFAHFYDINKTSLDEIRLN